MSNSIPSTPKVSPPRLDLDGHIKITPAAIIPSKFLKGRDNFERKHRLNSWKRGVPDYYIQDFIEYGLSPFLKSHGYKIGLSLRDTIKYCKEWAFAHVEKESNHRPIKEIHFIRCAHNAGQEELDWYLHKICIEEWYILYDDWQTNEFLDDSDAGHAQRVDLPFFAWRLINLYSSKSHIEYLEFINNDEDMNDDTNYNQTNFTNTMTDDNYGK